MRHGGDGAFLSVSVDGTAHGGDGACSREGDGWYGCSGAVWEVQGGGESLSEPDSPSSSATQVSSKARSGEREESDDWRSLMAVVN